MASGVIAAVALAASACSSSSASSGGAGAAGATGSTTGSGGTVSTRSTSQGTVVVTSSGMTLYHLTTEHSGQIQCTGGCATTWPPYTVSSGTMPSGASGLGTVSRPDGSTQVTYNGEALYLSLIHI